MKEILHNKEKASTPIQVFAADKTRKTAGCYHDIVYKNGTLTIKRHHNGGGGSSSSPSYKTETTTTSDGTKVEVTIKPDGTKVETTKTPDGMVSLLKQKKMVLSLRPKPQKMVIK